MPEERAVVHGLCAAREHADLSTRSLSFLALALHGIWISHHTFWRHLRALGASGDRVRRRRRPAGQGPDTSFALEPNDLWCWDLTHLKTLIPWRFLYLYVVEDWVSRKVVAWHLTQNLRSEEVQVLWDQAIVAEQLLEGPRLLYPKSLSDRGTQMRAARTKRFFRRASIEQLFARPRTPNDNPEIEALFSTMKGRPHYPDRFEGYDDAYAWCEGFFRWYNHRHHHSALGYVTPADRHAGRHHQILAERARIKALTLARRRRARGLDPGPTPALSADGWVDSALGGGGQQRNTTLRKAPPSPGPSRPAPSPANGRTHLD